MAFFDERVLREFDPHTFTDKKPFPWHNFSQIVTPQGFEKLYREFPPLTLFDKHVGMMRSHGQRPHDRYYLAYEHSIYGAKSATPGAVKHEDLPGPWQEFISELQTSDAWKQFAERLVGQGNLTARYAWHVGTQGSEVSPHRDSDDKLATHIFYFNTSDDWEEAWGGSTLVLSGKKTDRMNPDFDDFTGEIASEICNNHSFLFKNTTEAWHGVRTLTCPPERYRRLFNVIFHADEAPKKTGFADRLKSTLLGNRK